MPASPRAQHAAAAMAASPSSSSPGDARKTAACTRCSRLKVKCDGGTPCARCVSVAGDAECFYRVALKRGPPKGCPPRGGVRKHERDEHSQPPPHKLAKPQQQQQQQQQQRRVRRATSAEERRLSEVAARESEAASHSLLALQGSSGGMFPSPAAQSDAAYFSHAAPHVRLGSNESAASYRSALSAGPSHLPSSASMLANISGGANGVYMSQAPSTEHGVGWAAASELRAPAVRTSPHAVPPVAPLPYSSPRSAHPAAASPPSHAGPSAPWNGGMKSEPPSALPHLPSERNDSPARPHGPYYDATNAAANHLLHTLDLEIERRLLQYFLSFIHSLWPMFYAPTIHSLRSLRQREPVLWKAVIGVAAATADSPETADAFSGPDTAVNPRHLSDTLIADARRSLLVEEVGNPRIASCQALLLVTLVELGHGRVSCAWALGGLACRQALDLRINVGETESDGAPVSWRVASAVQEARRTYWAAYALDKILCAVLEKPVMLRAAESSQPLPATSRERDEHDLWLSHESEAARFVTPAALEGLQGRSTHSLSNFVAWVELLQILETVISDVFTRRAGHSRGTAQASQMSQKARLVSWTARLPQHLRWSSPTARAMGGGDDARAQSGPGEVVMSHQLTMRAWLCLTCLLLHRPLVSAPSGEPTKGSKATLSAQQKGALDVCFAAASEICELFDAYESCYRSRKVPSSWSYLIFSAATIFAPLSRSGSALAFASTSQQRFTQCIATLQRLSQTWEIGRLHAQILISLGGKSPQGLSPAPPAVEASVEEQAGHDAEEVLQPPPPQQPALPYAQTQLAVPNNWGLSHGVPSSSAAASHLAAPRALGFGREANDTPPIGVAASPSALEALADAAFIPALEGTDLWGAMNYPIGMDPGSWETFMSSLAPS